MGAKSFNLSHLFGFEEDIPSLCKAPKLYLSSDEGLKEESLNFAYIDGFKLVILDSNPGKYKFYAVMKN